MLRPSLALTLLAATSAVAAPLERRLELPNGDLDILNYALMLEYLEKAFYEQGLAKYSEEDFADAGLGGDFYGNLLTLFRDEKTHVELLAGALGENAIGAPTFAFPDTSPVSFAALATILEGVGVSAYLGAAAEIDEKAYLTVAASIMDNEARHSSFLRSQLNKKPFPHPFDTPITFNVAFSLAAAFVTGLAEGTDLPFSAYPPLAVAPSSDAYSQENSAVVFTGAHANAMAGQVVVPGTDVYALFFSGLSIFYEKVAVSGDDYVVDLPAELPGGQVYVLLSTASGVFGDLWEDGNTVSGVGILDVKAA